MNAKNILSEFIIIEYDMNIDNEYENWISEYLININKNIDNELNDWNSWALRIFINSERIFL